VELFFHIFEYSLKPGWWGVKN